MNLKIIVNPVASGANIKRIVPEITRYFKQRSTSVSLEYTSKPHDATNIARAASLQDYDAIIAVGGDGTVNEVVNGIINSQAALAIIPAGSANDFAKELHIPTDILNACELILSANRAKIDIGKVNDRYFINVAGVGLDAQVSEAVNESSHKARGLLQYAIALAKVLISSHPNEFSLVLDGKARKVRAWLISVGNGKQFGGGMKIIPTANMGDGLFDICVIKDVKKWSVVYYLPLVIRGKHLGLSTVSIYRAKEVEIKGLGCLGHADGETIRGDIFKFEVVPDAIEVIVPAAPVA